MNDEQKKTVLFEDVENAANKIIGQGDTPTVNSVIDRTGGRRENVGKFLISFWDKRDQEASKIADEIGSSEIGRLLAVEMHNIVVRKTETLKGIIERQKAQIDEWQQLTEKHELDCQERIQLAVIESGEAIRSAEENIVKANDIADKAVEQKNDALVKAKQATEDAEQFFKSEKTRADTLIESAKAEANSLVKVSDKRLESAELELKSLREQVGNLTVDEARRQIEKEHFNLAKTNLSSLQLELADCKTNEVRLSTQLTGYEKDVTRLNDELLDTKGQLNKSADAQVMLIEAQKQVHQLQHELTLSERETKSLSQALAVSTSQNKID